MRKLMLAAAAVALIATPALAKKKPAPTPAPTQATAPAPTKAPPPAIKGGTMKECAAQWDKFSDAQKGAYKTQALSMKSKSGGKLSGYQVFTGACLRKK